MDFDETNYPDSQLFGCSGAILKSYLHKILIPHGVHFVVGLILAPIPVPSSDPSWPALGKIQVYFAVLTLTPVAWWLSFVLLGLPAAKPAEPVTEKKEEKTDAVTDCIVTVGGSVLGIGLIFLAAFLVVACILVWPLLWLGSVCGCLIMHLSMGTPKQYAVLERKRQRRADVKCRRRHERQTQREREAQQQQREHDDKQAARKCVVSYYQQHDLQASLPPELLQIFVRSKLEQEGLTTEEVLRNAEGLLRRLHRLVLQREEELAQKAQTEQSMQMSAAQRDAIDQQVRALERERDRQIEHVWRSDKEGNMKAAEVEWISNQFEQQIVQLRKGKP